MPVSPTKVLELEESLLLTNVVSLYSIYNGPKKLKKISQDINNKAKYFINKLQHTCIANDTFYDTISIKVKDTDKLVNQISNKTNMAKGPIRSFISKNAAIEPP